MLHSIFGAFTDYFAPEVVQLTTAQMLQEFASTYATELAVVGTGAALLSTYACYGKSRTVTPGFDSSVAEVVATAAPLTALQMALQGLSSEVLSNERKQALIDLPFSKMSSVKGFTADNFEDKKLQLVALLKMDSTESQYIRVTNIAESTMNPERTMIKCLQTMSKQNHSVHTASMKQ